MSNPRDSFVPLTAHVSGGVRSNHPITVIAQAAEAQPFRPLGTTGTGPGASPKTKAACEPRVHLKREGDRVTGIEVHCTCGNVIELACVYDAPAETKGKVS
jgi:hypothetical protein